MAQAFLTPIETMLKLTHSLHNLGIDVIENFDYMNRIIKKN